MAGVAGAKWGQQRRMPGYSGNDSYHRSSSRKKSNKSSEEKAQELLKYGEENGYSDITKFSEEELVQIFKQSFKDNAQIGHRWKECLGFKRKRGYIQVSQEPSVETECIGATPTVQTQSEYVKSLMQLPTLSGEVRWLPTDSDDIGYFFVNKPFVDKEKQRRLTVPGVDYSMTKVVDFLDVVEMDGLKKAVILDDQQLLQAWEYICKFPKDTHVTLICHMDKERNSCPVFEEITLCTSNQTHVDYNSQDEYSGGSNCSCPGIRKLTMLHPINSRQINSRLMLLRYETRLRIVIPSSSMNATGWDHLAQFGWYKDFPIGSSQPDSSESGQNQDEVRSCEAQKGGKFRECLQYFLSCMQFESSSILEGVQFNVLSPSVHLISTIHSPAKPDPENPLFQYHYGLNQLQPLLQPIQAFWNKDKNTQMLMATTKLGSLNGLRQLPDICQLPRGLLDVHKMENVSILYPSRSYVAGWLKKHPEANTYDAFINNETTCEAWWYLKNPVSAGDCGDIVLPRMNLCMQHVTLEFGRLGWLLTGSHQAAWGSWSREVTSHACCRYELSMALIPYVEMKEDTESTGARMCAVDLRSIKLPFERMEPYTPSDCPVTNSRDLRYLFGRVEHREYGQHPIVVRSLDLPKYDPLMSIYSPFTHSSGGVAVVPRDILCRFDPTYFPHPGTILCFWACRHQHISSRAGRITHAFQSLGDLRRHHGIDTEPLWKRQQSMTRAQRDLAEFNRTYGEDEESYHKYWQEKWNKWWTMDLTNTRWLTPENMEAEFPMAPMKLVPDVRWLGKHLTQTCNGKTPETKGPHSLLFLRKYLKMQFNKHIQFVLYKW